MAGNPFRKGRPAESVSVPPDDVPTTPPLQTQTTKKKVKIQSPAEEIPRRVSAGRISPPPPPRPYDDDDDDSDSTATADEEIEEASLNTRRNSGSLPSMDTPGPSGTGAPFNPFARTLATSEASFGLQQAKFEQQDSGMHDGQGQGRPAMDVDQFKNILMTGSAAPSPPVSTPSQRLPDSSSSTDASSASRQSLFDPGLDYHQESPRTSFDQMESASSEDDEAYGDEGSNLMSGTGRLDDLAPPAPPKHILGKPSGLKGPQTVSFADFDEEIPSSLSHPTMHSAPTNAASGFSNRPSAPPRSPSDLNKPLPPPPQSLEQTAPSIPESSVPPSGPHKSTPSIPTTEDSPQQKKAPPPPPTSRRGGRERAGSGSNQQSFEDDNTPQSKSADTPSKSSAPPPPPRKTRPSSQIVAQPVETTPEAPSPAPSSTDSKPMPPPPRRNQSKSSNVLNRTPSNASRSSTSQAQPTQSAAAPVPPPPRRAGSSKRESFDARRSSGHEIRSSFESDRSHRQHGEAVVSPAASTSSKDILADMTAFQAEIDALRAKHEKGG